MLTPAVSLFGINTYGRIPAQGTFYRLRIFVDLGKNETSADVLDRRGQWQNMDGIRDLYQRYQKSGRMRHYERKHLADKIEWFHLFVNKAAADEFCAELDGLVKSFDQRKGQLEYDSDFAYVMAEDPEIVLATDHRARKLR